MSEALVKIGLAINAARIRFLGKARIVVKMTKKNLYIARSELYFIFCAEVERELRATDQGDLTFQKEIRQ